MVARAQSHQRKAKAVFCLNNLKQWGIATHIYTTDNNDFLPPDGTPNPSDTDINTGWYIQLPQTLSLPRYHDMAWRTNASADVGRSVWICPSNPRRSNTNNLFHYCPNENVNGTGAGNHPVKITTRPRHSAMVWLFDSKNLPAVGTPNFVHTNLHNQGAQFTFLDGHATGFKNTEYWDFAADKGRTNNASLVWYP